MKYLITQSLISAWQYMFECYEGGEDGARESFLATLRREPVEQTEAMLNGIEFEKAVYEAAECAERAPHPKWEQGIQKVAPLVSGAQKQVRLSREIEVEGLTLVVYGILDALKAGVIDDVKYKSKSFGSLELAGSYLNSPQHPLYFYICPEAYKFQYLVSDGKELYIETYTPEMSRTAHEVIGEFIRGITGMGLLETYKEKWAAA